MISGEFEQRMRELIHNLKTRKMEWEPNTTCTLHFIKSSQNDGAPFR